MKLLALSLHNFGARSYRFLSRIIALPSKTSLCMWLHSLSCEPGFSGEIFVALKHKLQAFSDRDKVCALMIDEMSLKSGLHYDSGIDTIIGFEDYGAGLGRRSNVVTSALVFMVRGLASNWKQPIAYVLTPSTCKMCDVKKLLFECLAKLHDIGLTVKVIISDQGSNFQQLANSLGVCVSRPYFELSNRKYYYMFDQPLKHTFHFDNTTASWKTISDFFNIDSKQKFRLAPRLTAKHLELPAFSKMKVKLAAQVLSRSVAAGLETHASMLGSDAVDTAEFVQKFDDIFDAVNSSQLKCEKSLKCAVSSDSTHVTFFHGVLNWLATLRVVNNAGVDKTNSIKCLKGWQISVSGIMQLWADLQNNHNFSFLFTRRLNQDPLENTFSIIRQKGGNCDHPSPGQFRHLFKQACCSKLLEPGKGANCELDMGSLLVILDEVKGSKRLGSLQHNVSKEVKSIDRIAVLPSCTGDILEDNGLYYVCGYLARKVTEWHPCTVCQSFFNSPSYDSKGHFTDLKRYNKQATSGGLITVADEFFLYVQQLENVFEAMFNKHKCDQSIVQQILTELVKCELPAFCADFPVVKFCALFARIRIFYTLKFENQKLITASKAKRKDRKLTKIKH